MCLKRILERWLPVVKLRGIVSDDLLASDDPVDLFHTKDGKNGGHFNEEGHRRLAQRLEKFLSDEAAAGALPVPRD